MYFGACYYPEHWPEERWETDARMMREAGFNMVRLAEFAWSKFERREGEYDFDWLERCLDLLWQHGIQATLGTPSATPPKWLMDKHPDIYMVDYDGRVKGFGNRRHYCYNNATYRQYVAGIVARMAERYADHPAVVAWQIDNEFGCNDTTRCYCDDCKAAFQQWLRNKYGGDIDALNESWGTVFWSQEYNDFSEVIVPAYTVFPLHNPGLVLDFRRFSSDSVRSFQKEQIDILRKLAPKHEITHNLMGAFNEIDYYNLSEDLDFISWDNYPNLVFTKEVNPALPAMQHDMTRSLKPRGFWVMEHQSGQPGGNIMFPTPKPGELRRWTYQSVAHGADGIVYFRWRGCLFGAEQYWHAILNHDGKPGRKYAEVQQVGAELKRLSPLLNGAVTKARAAMVRSYDIEWVFEIQPHVMDYSFMNHFTSFYQALYDKYETVDIISPDADFSAYELVVLPNFIMAEQAVADKLYAYVQGGGVAVMDFRAGAKDWSNRMEPLTLPGKFAELLGIEVPDYGVLGKEEKRRITVEGEATREFFGGTWYDVVRETTAEPIARYAEDYFAGSAAVTRNAYGKGAAYYIGTQADAGLLRLVVDRACHDGGLGLTAAGIHVPDKVENTVRHKGETAYYFVINHSVAEAKLSLDFACYDHLAECVREGLCTLEGNGVMILERQSV